MRFVDSHCHLCDKRLQAERQTLIERAAAAGVGVFVVNAAQPEEWETLARADDRRIVKFIGVHPWYADRLPDDWLMRLQTLVACRGFGIGEIGLDNLRGLNDRANQERVFRAQWRLVQEMDLPAAVHCVRAWDRLQAALKEVGAPRSWLLHAFGGDAALCLDLARQGAWFSFNGAITYESRRRMRAAAAAVPLHRILIESDAPDFAPQQARAAGCVINEPAHLVEVAVALANLRQMPLPEMAEILWENSRRFLGSLWPQV